MRALDFQTARENAEPLYAEILRNVYKVEKCNEDMAKSDFIMHTESARNIIEKHFKGRIQDAGMTFGADLEDMKGMPLTPTTSFVIAEQMQRTICGDRFWYDHSDIFRDGKRWCKSSKVSDDKNAISDQRDRINSIDFFTLMCACNNCNGTRIQAEPFLSVGPSNLKKLCPSVASILRNLDLGNW